MTDSSKDGPAKGAPAIMPTGIMGDRAAVIFAAPKEINKLVEAAMLNGDGIAAPFGPAGVRGGYMSPSEAPVRRGRWLICFYDQDSSRSPLTVHGPLERCRSFRSNPDPARINPDFLTQEDY
jgi:hypothetical protein